MKEGSLTPAGTTRGFLTDRTRPKSRELQSCSHTLGPGVRATGFEGQELGEGTLRFTDAVSHGTAGAIRKPNSWTEGLATHRQCLKLFPVGAGALLETPSPDVEAFRVYLALEEGSVQSEPWGCPQLQSLSSHTHFTIAGWSLAPGPPLPFSTPGL